MIRRFHLDRREDVSGVSGTGVVAKGYKFFGWAVIVWPRPWPTITLHPRGMKSVEHIHCHGGKTQIVWN